MKKPSRMILAGGNGYLGQALARWFQSRGYEIVVLTRTPGRGFPGTREVSWDGMSLGNWGTELDGAEVLINLAGKTVNCRYNRRNREAILRSRLESTRILGQAVKACRHPPKVWINMSTATIYRHTLGDAWDEAGEIAATAEAKDAFSVKVAREWELAFEAAETPGVRKVATRLAMVLGCGPNSVFPTLRRLVKMGLGGRMGSGRQYVSWIHESDFCRAIEFLMGQSHLSGVVNLAAPGPVTNAEMMAIFRAAFGRPLGLPATTWMLELGARLMGTETELILKSRRVIPGRLLSAGFEFDFPSLANAVEQLARKCPRDGATP